MITHVKYQLFMWLFFAIFISSGIFFYFKISNDTSKSSDQQAGLITLQSNNSSLKKSLPESIQLDEKTRLNLRADNGSCNTVDDWLAKNSIDPSHRNQDYTDEDRWRGRPYILHEVKTAFGHSLIIGILDERRHYERHLYCKIADGDYTAHFVTRYAKRHSTVGGFLFDVRESPPQRVGLIIPKIIDPYFEASQPANPNASPLHGEELEAYVTQIHTKHQASTGRNLEDKAVDHELDANSIILPLLNTEFSPNEPTFTPTVRVVWLKITPEGYLIPE